jgi:fatty-acyl-CoA synthase
MRRIDISTGLTRSKRMYGDATFIEFGDRRISFNTFDARVSRLAGALRNGGIRQGEAVVIVMTNRPEWVESVFAVVRAGALFVPVNRRLTAANVGAIIDETDARVLIVESEFTEILQEASAKPMLRQILVVGKKLPEGTPSGTQLYDDAISAAGSFAVHEVAVPDDAAQAIYYTSGTTGAGKGVIRSHASNFAMAYGSLSRMPVGRQDSWFYAIPVHSAGFFALALPALYGGGSILLSKDFDPERALDLMALHGVTHSMFVPTMWEMLMQHEPDRPTLPRLRHAVWGGMPMIASTAERLSEWLPVPCLGGYGLTEATCTTWSTPEIFASGRVDSAGTPVESMEIRVVDANDEDVSPGEYGEVCLRGALTMEGYHKRPSLTAEVLQPDGWLRTGDWGRLDEDGALTVVDRIKDMIISGGENVYSSEVEGVISKVPGVREVAVVGVPHAVWGQEVAAVLVTDGVITTDDIDLACQNNLARFKRPRRFVTIEQLPKNATGKVLKYELTSYFPS